MSAQLFKDKHTSRCLGGKESCLPVLETQEIQVRSLGWEDPLEKGMAAHSSVLACRIPCTEEAGGLSPWGHKELDTTEHARKEHTSQ